MSYIVRFADRADRSDILKHGFRSKRLRSSIARNNQELLAMQTLPDIEIVSVRENEYFTFPFKYPVKPVGPIDEDDNWGSVFLSVKRLRDIGATGAGVRVGIIDSGIDTSHGCFGGINLAKFVEIDKDSGSVNETVPYDSQWHGTFCTAILAGRSNKGRERGLAPDAQLYVAKVFDKQWASSLVSVENAFRFCIDNKVRVISMSLGIPNQDDVWIPVVTEFIETGGILVSGIGNDFGGEGPTISPGNYPLRGILSVGAHSIDQKIWKSSGGGEISWPDAEDPSGSVVVIKPDLVAPGVGIMSVGKNAEMEVSEGTSFSAPHIAGLVACIWGIRPKWTAEQVLKLILENLHDHGQVGKDIRFGNGIIDADALCLELISSS